MTTFQKAFLAICAVLVLSIAYYFVIFLPKSETDKLNQYQQVQENINNAALVRKQQLTQCMLDAENTYMSNWANSCRTDGMDTTGPKCKLPSYQANSIEAVRRTSNDNCFKLFPQN